MTYQNSKSHYSKMRLLILIGVILGLIISLGFTNIQGNVIDGSTIQDSLILDDNMNFGSHDFSISADSPNITSSDNFWYIEGITGNSITWNITDFTVNNPTYFVERNGLEIVANKTWTSGESITLIVDGLTAELYNFTIVYTDGFGELYSDTILVNVVANVDPSINHPEDITFTFAESNQAIIWFISDITSFNLTYEIYLNGLPSGPNFYPTSYLTVNLDISHLGVGSYNFTIYVDDSLGGFTNDTVWVFVLENTSTTPNNPITFIGSISNGILSLSALISISITVVVISKRRKR